MEHLIILQAKGFDFVQILLLGGMVLVMWLFILRPQSKKAKEAQKFIENLDKGTRIVTTGGIYGKIIKVDEDSFLVEIDTNTKIRIDKSAVSSELTQKLQKKETPAS